MGVSYSSTTRTSGFCGRCRDKTMIEPITPDGSPCASPTCKDELPPIEPPASGHAKQGGWIGPPKSLLDGGDRLRSPEWRARAKGVDGVRSGLVEESSSNEESDQPAQLCIGGITEPEYVEAPPAVEPDHSGRESNPAVEVEEEVDKEEGLGSAMSGDVAWQGATAEAQGRDETTRTAINENDHGESSAMRTGNDVFCVKSTRGSGLPNHLWSSEMPHKSCLPPLVRQRLDSPRQQWCAGQALSGVCSGQHAEDAPHRGCFAESPRAGHLKAVAQLDRKAERKAIPLLMIQEEDEDIGEDIRTCDTNWEQDSGEEAHAGENEGETMNDSCKAEECEAGSTNGDMLSQTIPRTTSSGVSEGDIPSCGGVACRADATDATDATDVADAADARDAADATDARDATASPDGGHDAHQVNQTESPREEREAREIIVSSPERGKGRGKEAPDVTTAQVSAGMEQPKMRVHKRVDSSVSSLDCRDLPSVPGVTKDDELSKNNVASAAAHGAPEKDATRKKKRGKKKEKRSTRQADASEGSVANKEGTREKGVHFDAVEIVELECFISFDDLCSDGGPAYVLGDEVLSKKKVSLHRFEKERLFSRIPVDQYGIKGRVDPNTRRSFLFM